jgi:hypothetical protein
MQTALGAREWMSDVTQKEFDERINQWWNGTEFKA